MRLLALLPLLLLTRVAAQAQTVINLVTDAASYAPRVAPGELASIFGSNLANSTQEAAGFPLPTNMAGATVYVNQSPVPLLYVSQTQINFQVPSGLAAGTASMYVTRSGGQSALFQFTVVSSAPGIFQDTSNHAIAQNPDYSTNSSTNPVASGAVVVVYLTGQGALNNAVPDGTATPNSPLSSATATATATIGGTNATVQFLGLTPGFTGLAQANIVVPGARQGGLSAGDYRGRLRERFGAGFGIRFGNRAAHVPHAGGPVEFCKRRHEQRRDFRQHHLPLRTESHQHHRHQRRYPTVLRGRVRRHGTGRQRR